MVAGVDTPNPAIWTGTETGAETEYAGASICGVLIRSEGEGEGETETETETETGTGIGIGPADVLVRTCAGRVAALVRVKGHLWIVSCGNILLGGAPVGVRIGHQPLRLVSLPHPQHENSRGAQEVPWSATHL